MIYDFPEKLVNLLLNMLPDIDYKESFCRAFISHYTRILKMLEQSTASHSLSNKVAHIGVQVFTDLVYFHLFSFY